MGKLILLVFALTLSACGTIRPIRIDSDPNQEALERMRDKQAEADEAAGRIDQK